MTRYTFVAALFHVGASYLMLACDGEPRSLPAPSTTGPSSQSSFATTASSASATATPLIGVVEAARLQSLDTIDPDNADRCELHLIIHIGGQDKPPPVLVLHDPTCQPSPRLEQRVGELVNEPWLFPIFVNTRGSDNSALSPLLARHVAFHRVQRPADYDSREGEFGTLRVVRSSPGVLSQGVIPSRGTCAFLVELREYLGTRGSDEVDLLRRAYQCIPGIRRPAP